jgi:hypothetical protein
VGVKQNKHRKGQTYLAVCNHLSAQYRTKPLDPTTHSAANA